MPGWSAAVIHEFNNRLTTTFLYARFVYYNAMRHLSEVDLTEKASKTSFSKDFGRRSVSLSATCIAAKRCFSLERYQEVESLIPIQDALIYKSNT